LSIKVYIGVIAEVFKPFISNLVMQVDVSCKIVVAQAERLIFLEYFEPL